MEGPNELGIIDYDDVAPEKDLHKNINIFRRIFAGDDTVKYRILGEKEQYCVIFIDGMINSEILNRYIITPVNDNPNRPVKHLSVSLHTNELETVAAFSEAVAAMLGGDTILLAEGLDEFFVMNTKGFPVRSINEPDNEKALYGPREGFTESLMQNAAMLRRKLKTSELKFKFLKLGTRTNTSVCVCYLESLVNKDVLTEIERRMDTISIDGIFDTYGIAERIKDSTYSIFNTVGKTERPDTVAAKLLGGGVAVMLDGTPVAMLAPYLFTENFRACDDYYLGFYYSSISRLLRYLAFFISISTGPVYISFVVFNAGVLPTTFMLTIASATSGVPIPTFMEFISMIILFEMLRETGIRMSSKLGQSLSIVGALVIGQAAVEARIISAPMVIIVAVSAISGLMVPGASTAVMITRIAAVILSSMLGFYGYGIAMLALCVHLFSLESFGIQYTAHMLFSQKEDIGDSYLRLPVRFHKLRTKFMAADLKRSK